MFGKLKEKLKSWISGTKEKLTIEEKVVETPKEEIKKKEGKPKEEKKEKEEIKPEKLKEKAIKKEGKIIEKPKKEIEQEIKEEVKVSEKQIQQLEKEIEITKEESIEPAPLKFDTSSLGYEPDIEKIKEEVIEQEIIQEEPKKQSFLSRLKSKFSYKITEEEFENIFEELEMILLENNLALEVTESLKKSLSERLIGREIKKDNLEEEIKRELKETINSILIEPKNPIDLIKSKKEKPFVILFFGINGTGKTTSIAKLANLLKKNELTSVMAAGDTFRAASIEQIKEHSERLNIPLIKHDYESDPAAVGFDAIKYAKKNKIDVVLIDTAGRMHTKKNLLAEMEKISRVTKPDLKIFVAEAIAGNDATEQAKSFNELIGIDGSILTKADIDEKGGAILSIAAITKKPIIYLGTGQKYDDLTLFKKNDFIKTIGL